jgi:hypothetical protein
VRHICSLCNNGMQTPEFAFARELGRRSVGSKPLCVLVQHVRKLIPTVLCLRLTICHLLRRMFVCQGRFVFLCFEQRSFQPQHGG